MNNHRLLHETKNQYLSGNIHINPGNLKKPRSRGFQQKEGNKLGAFLLIVFNNKIGSNKITFLIHNNIILVYILH